MDRPLRRIYKETKSPVVKTLMRHFDEVITPRQDVPLVSIQAAGTSINLIFREDFLEEVSDKELEALTRHELYHIAFNHVGRVPCREQDGAFCREMDANRWMSESDNKVLKEVSERLGLSYTDPYEAFDALDLPRKSMHSIPIEFIHRLIHPEDDEGEGEGQFAPGEGNQACDGGGQPGEGEGSGNEGGEELLKAIANAAHSQISEELSQNGIDANKFGQARGDGAGNYGIEANAERPEWLEELMKWARQNIVEPSWKDRRAHSRPNLAKRQANIHSPTLKRRAAWEAKNVVFAVDTSGSMVGSLGPVEFVVRYLEQHDISVRLIMCDTRVVYDGPGLPWPGIQGGGGTVLQPMVDAINEKKDKNTKAVVWFSDGYWERQPYVEDVEQLYVVGYKGSMTRHDVEVIDWTP